MGMGLELESSMLARNCSACHSSSHPHLSQAYLLSTQSPVRHLHILGKNTCAHTSPYISASNINLQLCMKTESYDGLPHCQPDGDFAISESAGRVTYLYQCSTANPMLPQAPWLLSGTLPEPHAPQSADGDCTLPLKQGGALSRGLNLVGRLR